jgi:hypothetical protein
MEVVRSIRWEQTETEMQYNHREDQREAKTTLLFFEARAIDSLSSDKDMVTKETSSIVSSRYCLPLIMIRIMKELQEIFER